MKKVILVTLVSMLLTGVAFAKGAAAPATGLAEQNVGCGWGTLLWKNNADNSALSQSTQASTNGILGNQTFGITSGTAGCKKPAKFAASDSLVRFAYNNLDSLAKDIAMGKGESLDTLAELMLVPAANRPAFASNLQSNFTNIFPTGKEDYAEVLDNIYVITVKNG